MSDFTSGFWSWYVGVVSVLSILACAVLLWIAGKATVAVHSNRPEDNTTGHVWDGNLCELNNPLPRWWMWLFIITVVFSLAYLVVFPGLGNFKGLLNWSTDSEHNRAVTQLGVEVAPLYAMFSAQSVDALAKDPRALAVGERLFMNNCAQCHASDGGGSKGFPNLTNANLSWLGERTAEHIVQTVTNGRTGAMPPMGQVVGGETQMSELANYVLSLSMSPHNASKAQSGRQLFTTCAGCHGIDGKGNKAIGAPNLTDDYWLHGWGEAAIVGMIKNGKSNVMPAQSPKLDASQIRLVSAYVLSFLKTSAATPEKTDSPSVLKIP